MADPTPGDLTSELALMRALLQDYLDRFDDHQPLPLDSIKAIYGMVESIAGTVKRIADILNSTALTQADIAYLEAVLSDEFRDDSERLDRILGRIRKDR